MKSKNSQGTKGKINPPKVGPKTRKSVKKEKEKVEFLRSPTGAYGLAYSVGDVAEVDPKLAKELFKSKFAKPVK